MAKVAFAIAEKQDVRCACVRASLGNDSERQRRYDDANRRLASFFSAAPKANSSYLKLVQPEPIQARK